MRIKPFQGLRPTPEQANLVASLPYDVVNTEEARQLAAGKPQSMLHVVRAEIDFPAGTDPYSDAVYAKAAENFQRLQAEGFLVRESAPSLYLYQQEMGSHRQRGIAALCHIDDYEKDLVKKHEKTRKAKEDDRARLTSDLSANSGPVFLTYRESADITAIMDQAAKTQPLFDFVADDKIRHTVWKIEGGADLVAAFESVPCFYVADGHHRAASAFRVGRERKAANPNHTGDEDYNWFMTVLFPGSELKILPYNRVVADLHKQSADAFLNALKAEIPVEETDNSEPSAPGSVHMYLSGKWYRLTLTPSPDADPVERLDVSQLQERVLAPLLGVGDPRTDGRIDFVGGIRGTGELVKKVDGGEAAVAFSMYPVTIDQLMAISDAGQIMPPKSTWFEPKLRSGLFIHTFEPAR